MAQNNCVCGKLKDEKYDLCYDCFQKQLDGKAWRYECSDDTGSRPAGKDSQRPQYKLPMHPAERDSMNRIVAVQSTAIVLQGRSEASQEQIVALFNLFRKLLE